MVEIFQLQLHKSSPHPDYQRRDGLGAPKELPSHFADHRGTEYAFLYHRYGVGRKLGADPKPVWSLPHRLFAGDGAVDRPDGIVFQARRPPHYREKEIIGAFYCIFTSLML